jgi:S-adenosylmethionine uptake transporter
MSAVIKLVSARYSVFEVVFYRGAVGALLLGAWIAARGGRAASERLGMHLARSLVGTVAMALWFYTIGRLPLATAVTLNYTSPLFIALIVAAAAWHLGQPNPARGPLYLAIVAGFVGVLLILRPSVEREQALELALGLLSGLLGAVAYLLVRQLGRAGEPEWRVVFWFSVVNMLFGAIAATLGGWQPLRAADLPLLLLIGALASAGQLMMTRAFSRGRTLLTANLQYLGVIFATAIGWLAFGERFEPIEAVGIGLIVASGLAATRVSPNPPVREPTA